jgi:hypothetical protein
MKSGWRRLNAESTQQVGIEAPNWPPQAAQKSCIEVDRKTMHHPRSTMNTAVWTVQVLWGVFFSVTGFGKVCCYKPALWNQAL